LTKIVSGKLSEVDTLLQKATNEEQDCSSIWRIGDSLTKHINILPENHIDFLLEYYQKYGKE